MRLLVIEDDDAVVRGICDYAEDKGWECEKCDFEEAKEKIACFNPEIIVMDWMYDAEEIDKGEPIFKEIYENEFRPTIIFSAVAKTIDMPDFIMNTPLIEIVPKGDEQVVIGKIEEWMPYIMAIRNLRIELNKSLLSSVQAVGNFMKMSEYPGNEVLKHMLNKRTTYFFDKEYVGDRLPAWVQYEYPPIQDSLLVADVLRVCSENLEIGKPGEPREYCVILTPSCDMARAKPGQTILVAMCQAAECFSNETKLGKQEKIVDKSAREKKEKLIRSLNAGYNFAKVALPHLPNKIPYMTINLKDIKQVAVGEISLTEHNIEGKKYYRVASIVSPFREQIVWAHMINSCRPGMPDRDMDAWAEGILLQ